VIVVTFSGWADLIKSGVKLGSFLNQLLNIRINRLKLLDYDEYFIPIFIILNDFIPTVVYFKSINLITQKLFFLNHHNHLNWIFKFLFCLNESMNFL
jgi:hypothetical protein